MSFWSPGWSSFLNIKQAVASGAQKDLRATHQQLKGGRQAMYYFIKIALTAVLVVAVSEISKRSSLLGGVLASLPLVSFLAMIWLYIDTGDTDKVSELSRNIFWLVLPSLSFFLLLPFLLKRGAGFGTSFGISTMVMIGLYFGMMLCLTKFNING